MSTVHECPWGPGGKRQTLVLPFFTFPCSGMRAPDINEIQFTIIIKFGYYAPGFPMKMV